MRATIPTLLVLAATAGTAMADIVPPREFVLARHGEMVVAKGWACPKVTASDPVDGYPELRAKGLTPNLVVCSNGAKYVVATPPRRRPIPGGAVEPSIEPEILKLD